MWRCRNQYVNNKVADNCLIPAITWGAAAVAALLWSPYPPPRHLTWVVHYEFNIHMANPLSLMKPGQKLYATVSVRPRANWRENAATFSAVSRTAYLHAYFTKTPLQFKYFYVFQIFILFLIMKNKIIFQHFFCFELQKFRI